MYGWRAAHIDAADEPPRPARYRRGASGDLPHNARPQRHSPRITEHREEVVGDTQRQASAVTLRAGRPGQPLAATGQIQLAAHNQIA
jgi:hypothetical protein